MIQYPLSFYAQAESEFGIQTPWNAVSSGKQIACAIPKEFEGPGEGISPEDLFAQAITNCFLATFKVYAEKSKLSFCIIQANTELIVDLDERKRPVMKEANLVVTVLGADQPDRLRMLAEKTLKSGFILNSIKTDVNLDMRFEGGANESLSDA